MGFPNSVDDLIRELDRRFPEPAIGPDTTMDQIKFDAGQRAVVAFLKRWRAESLAPKTEPRQRGGGRDVRGKSP